MAMMSVYMHRDKLIKHEVHKELKGNLWKGFSFIARPTLVIVVPLVFKKVFNERR